MNNIISVVTISFNQSKYLTKAFESIHQQNCRSTIEHIIVDPGSTDGSRALIDGRLESLKVIYEQDAGPSDGLNKGFSIATGDICYFLNADDIVLPGAFRFAEDFFLNNPSVDVLYGAGYIIDDLDQRIKFVRPTYFSCRTYLSDATNVLQQSFFFRKKAFDNVGGFNASNRVSWDGELFFKMKAAGSTFYAVYAPLGEFRVYGGTITATDGHAARRKAIRDNLANIYLGRELGCFDVFSRFFWLINKQISVLTIFLRTRLLHWNSIKSTGLERKSFFSIFS